MSVLTQCIEEYVNIINFKSIVALKKKHMGNYCHTYGKTDFKETQNYKQRVYRSFCPAPSFGR